VTVINPETGLDTDLEWQVNLLFDIVQQREVQQELVNRRKATAAGLATLLGMLNATAQRLGKGWSPAWWKTYARHVRKQFATVLEDKHVRRVIAMHLAWQRGAPYKQVLKEMVQLHRELSDQQEWEGRVQKSGIILVGN
jgi:hypothetical protein